MGSWFVVSFVIMVVTVAAVVLGVTDWCWHHAKNWVYNRKGRGNDGH